MKIGHKLSVAFLAISLVIAGAGFSGIYKMNQSIDTYAKVVQIDYGNEQEIASMLVDFKTQVQEWKNTLLRGKDPQQLDKYWTAFQRHEGKVAETARNLQSSLPEGEVRTLIEKFAQAHAQMGEDYRKGFESFKAAGFDAAAGDVAVKGKDRLPAELLDQARTKIMESTKTSGTHAAETSRQAMQTSMILMLLGFAGAIAGGILASRSITRPLENAIGIAERVAQGDLSSDIVVTTKDETGQLLAALKRMTESLSNMVSQIRGGAEMIATASGQIASGNQDLSSRTEEQASSLEETASSMEELTVTVRQNADNARQANQLALSASGVAVKGGTVVTQMVSTMGSINESSRKIVDIISVIDGIAFQTNILALNAAVEAARAGEQGRGFAVVAAEVRNLAQRSAAAAKEIKALIDDSVEKVDSGSTLVAEAGATMNEIVASVKRVTDIMGEIMGASQEQSAGIEQVNKAIGQMDQVTQQNAALVEEATAAAESLQSQAGNLVQAVSVFRLDHRLTGRLPSLQPSPSARPAKTRPSAIASKAPRAKGKVAAVTAPAAMQIPAPRTANNAGNADDEDWEAF